jgi:hypothetical protein
VMDSTQLVILMLVAPLVGLLFVAWSVRGDPFLLAAASYRRLGRAAYIAAGKIDSFAWALYQLKNTVPAAVDAASADADGQEEGVAL